MTSRPVGSKHLEDHSLLTNVQLIRSAAFPGQHVEFMASKGLPDGGLKGFGDPLPHSGCQRISADSDEAGSDGQPVSLNGVRHERRQVAVPADHVRLDGLQPVGDVRGVEGGTEMRDPKQAQPIQN